MKSHTYAFVKERSHTGKMISHTQAFDKRKLSSKERGCLMTKVPETGNGKGKNRNTVKPRLTAASVMRSPRYNSYFFLDRLAKTAIHSLVKKTVVNGAKFFQSIGDHITGFPCTTKQRMGNEATDRDRAKGFSRFSFSCSPTSSVQ